MKYNTLLFAVSLAAICLRPAAIARQVEGAHTDHLGRSHDARSNAPSEGGRRSEGTNDKPNVSDKKSNSKKESTAERAAKDLKNLSDGIDRMIERNEKTIRDLRSKGTVSAAGQKMIETNERETAKLLEQAGQAAKQNIKDLTRTSPVSEAVEKAKIVKEAARSVKAMEDAKQGVLDAVDAEEKLGALEQATEKLKTSKSEVDKLQKAYSDAARSAPATDSTDAPEAPAETTIHLGRVDGRR
jgi:hypothetical protein